MARSENQKQKLLLLKDYLEQRTDEEHPATLQEIRAWLERRGVSTERKTVYADLQTLEDYGMDILRTGGKFATYSLGGRQFDLAELKLLVDAVLSARFLSERKSSELIKKLSTLTSVYNAGILKRQVMVSGRVKSMNESVIYNVDIIHQAIGANRRICFRYFELDLRKQRSYRGGTRIASPYALCWDDANYYLIAHTHEHGLTHFRVDKMAQIQITNEPRTRTKQTDSLDLSDYHTSVFGMFGGERQKVRLRFDNSLSGVVIDRFGKDVMLIPDGETHFTYTADVCLSPNFCGWLASFGSRVEILGPDAVIEQMKALCRDILDQYDT